MIVDRGRIAALLATGMTAREVVEEIGISKSVVHRMTGRSGLVAALAAGFKRLGVAKKKPRSSYHDRGQHFRGCFSSPSMTGKG
jgi:hypothetical protein